MTKRFEANWRTREMLAIALAWRLGRLKLKAVPTGDFGSAPLPVFIKKVTKRLKFHLNCNDSRFFSVIIRQLIMHIISFMLSVRECTGDKCTLGRVIFLDQKSSFKYYYKQMR